MPAGDRKAIHSHGTSATAAVTAHTPSPVRQSPSRPRASGTDRAELEVAPIASEVV